MVFAVSLGLIAVATFMLFGWGWAFCRMAGLEGWSWPATAVLGMGAIIFAGGVLNLCRLAYPGALLAIAVIGILLAIAALPSGTLFESPPMVAWVLIAAILFFSIATQLPPSLYNFHDDFQKYFAYPVRMIETGTVFGSPLSAMGLQTLGAQAFLDGFVVAFFPIVYINGVDAIFGLFLCLILAAQITRNRPITVMCVLSVFLINPQYVNISTLYCGSAVIMAIAIASAENSTPSAAALGLLYAALIAMKPIFAVFVAIHLAAMAFGRIRWAIRTGLASALFLLPWALVHAPNYFAALHARPVPIATPAPTVTDAIKLFSWKPLEYGSTTANYTLLVAAIALCGLICWKARAQNVLACCVAGVVTFFVFVYVLGPMNYGYHHGLRYFTAVVIGLAPVIFGCTAVANQYRGGRIWLSLVVAAIPLAAFGPSLRTRVLTALHTHSMVSYSWVLQDEDYVDYIRRVLYGPERQAVHALQQRVPAGEPILAWTNTPFYLDYRRNRIIDIDTAGIGTPWARMPEASYLIWDYDGFATLASEDHTQRTKNAGANERKDAALTLEFIKQLNLAVSQGEVIYDDDDVKIVRLKK